MFIGVALQPLPKHPFVYPAYATDWANTVLGATATAHESTAVAHLRLLRFQLTATSSPRV